MREVTFKRMPGVGAGPLPPEDGALVDLVLAIPTLIVGTWRIPPLRILNDVLRRGERDAGMGGGALWEPFEIRDTEYRELVAELQRRGTSRGRFGWGEYDLPEPPADVGTFEDYVQWWTACALRGRPTSDELLRAGLKEAQVALDDARGTNNSHEVAKCQLELWEAQQAFAEYLIARWNVRLRDRAALDRLIELMGRAGELRKQLWLAEREGDTATCLATRDEFELAQRSASGFLQNV